MTSQPPGEITATPAQRIGWAILILTTLYICYFSHLGVIGFVGPDEPRYAWIARDMAETGDWVTPRLYGKPWFEKPPLLYWGGAIFFKLFGSSAPEVAARLPSAISALLATLALAWLAWRTYGEECARWLLLLLPTSVGMIGFSHGAATDMPFASITQRWRDAFRLFHPTAMASFCLTALPWYILCARRNPDFFRIFIIEHNFKRYLTPEFQHVQPFWFYVPVLLVAFLPWSFLVVIASASGIRELCRNRQINALTCLILCWSSFCFVFFSISRSKLPGYVLPAVPAIALLVVHAISGSRWFLRRLAAWSLVGGGCVYLGATIFSRFGNQWIRSWEMAVISFVTCGAFSLATIFVGFSFFFPPNSTRDFSLRAASVLAIALLMEMAPYLIERTNLEVLSGKWIARRARSEVPDLEKLRTFGYRRDYRYALNFYLHREVPDWTEAPISDGYVLSKFASCDKLKTLDHCEDLGGTRDFVPSGALLRITPNASLDRPGGGRQPK